MRLLRLGGNVSSMPLRVDTDSEKVWLAADLAVFNVLLA